MAINKKFIEQFEGSFASRYLIELCSNSAHFPIANITLEWLIDQDHSYFLSADPYILIIGALIQSYYLTYFSSAAWHRITGNFVAPLIYSIVETLIFGMDFWQELNHSSYLLIALIIGLTQWIHAVSSRDIIKDIAILFENIVRTGIVFLMYYIFETHANPSQTSSFEEFFTDTSHQFIGMVVLLLGIVIGISNITRSHYLRLLRQTSEQLKLFSEWLLGKELLHKSFTNPETLQLRRCERTILFMDIRGFTAWSEQNPPETVVNLLQKYYSVIEHVAKEHHVIKFKLSADEAMLIFADASDAITAARDLQLQTLPILESAGLGVGIGINQGIVVEGLLGSSGVMFYDVIGDTVNTAKRIESSAKKGEILIESTLFAKTGIKPNQEKMREIIVKGKSSPIIVYSVS